MVYLFPTIYIQNLAFNKESIVSWRFELKLYQSKGKTSTLITIRRYFSNCMDHKHTSPIDISIYNVSRGSSNQKYFLIERKGTRQKVGLKINIERAQLIRHNTTILTSLRGQRRRKNRAKRSYMRSRERAAAKRDLRKLEYHIEAQDWKIYSLILYRVRKLTLVLCVIWSRK